MMSADSFEDMARVKLNSLRAECLHWINYTAPPLPDPSGPYCEPSWDNTLLCWNYTLHGTYAQQSCTGREFIGLSNGTAYRYCFENGTYAFPNYTDCYVAPQKPCTFSDNFIHHMKQIQLMSNAGYSISLLVLITAIIVLVICRKPTRPTNNMRLNLFLALAIKATLGLLRQAFFYENVAFEKDLVKEGNTTLLLFTNATHWECKLLVTLTHYAYAAVYMWVLAEGVFLHCIVYDTFNAGRDGVKPYIIFGWLSPMTFIIPWVTLRILYLDEACWNTSPDPRSFWLLRGPILATLCINMVFLSRIIKALFMRLNETSSRMVMSRKLAKFTLTLFLLFGAYYVIFAVWPENANPIDAAGCPNPDSEITKLYAEMFVNSFQGLFVSVVFCFFNDEIKSRLKVAILRRRSSSSRSRNYNRPKIVAFPIKQTASMGSGSTRKYYVYTAQKKGPGSPEVETSSTSGTKRNGSLHLVKMNARNKNGHRNDMD